MNRIKLSANKQKRKVWMDDRDTATLDSNGFGIRAEVNSDPKTEARKW